jgi:hypothetical protein
MAICIVMPRTARWRVRVLEPSWSVNLRLPGARAERAVYFATAGLLGYVALRSAWFAQIFLTEKNATRPHAAWDVTGLALCVPLLVAVIVAAASGRRSRASLRSVAGLAVVVFGVLPLGGVLWLVLVQYLAGAVLVAFPLRWALPSFAATLVMPVLATHLEHQTRWTVYMCVTTLSGGLALGVLTWLVRAVRQAQSARLQLADQAVIADRVRIDAELTRSVSLALERIVAAAEQAGSRTDQPELAAADLEELVAFSRQTLSRTRQTLAGYQRTSVEAELQTAAALLAGAGLPTTIELPADGLPATVTNDLRTELRAGVGRMLADSTAIGCTISVRTDSVTGECELHFAARYATSVGAQ